MKCDEQQMYK